MNAIMEQKAPAALGVETRWLGADKTSIEITTSTVIGGDDDHLPYQLGYVILENGLHGDGEEWNQSNGLHNWADGVWYDPNLMPYVDMPEQLTNMKYNHVPVAAWGTLKGLEGTVPESVIGGEIYGHTFNANIAENTHIQNKDSLSVVVLLLNKNTGAIINATQCKVGESSEIPEPIKKVTITANSYTRAYGDDNPVFGYTSSNNENFDGEPEITCEATITSPVGTYPIVIKSGTVSGIEDTYVNGTLTITKAPLTITAKSYTITQGDALPTFEAEYSGFKNDETADILNKKPVLTTSVTSSSEPGTFDIVASGAEAQNYEISYVKGTLTINPGVYKLIYKVDGEVYKTYDVVYGDAITPEPEPTKEGYTFSGWSEIPETMPAHDVTVTGSFSINSYKLTYTVDGEVYKTYDIEYGATITPEAEPTKEGYTFSGWSTIPETMPAHDVTISGTFIINKYKLTYVVDGEVYKTYEMEYGATITPETEPSKEGYTFSGWSTIPVTMPAHDVTVIGTFSINSYKLIYTVDGEVYKTYDIEFGATITPEPAPTKEGYTFSGWSEIPETMPAHDVTVTGSFSINSYKLTYTVDGEVYKTYDIEYGTTITPEAEPTKEGYNFSGWSEIPATMPAHDVTVTGSFSKGQYKLIYMVDGQTYKTISYDYGDAITPEPVPVREGYTFSGWSEIPETMPAHDVTVIGTFSINNYKLIYTVDGVEYKSYDIEYGATITPEVEPTKEGYTFSGWSEIPETMPAHDVTVTGTFSINKYKLTYTVDGEVYKTYEMEYGATITPEVEPTKEGYTFSGWSEIPATMPAHDVTVTGTFTLDTGIEEIMSNANGDVMIFTIDGKRVDNLKKGMNIIRMKDGTTRKVVVK